MLYCIFFFSDIYNEILVDEFDRFDNLAKMKPHLLNCLRDSYNVTLFMKAIEDGEYQLFYKLLDYPQDISIVDNYGMNVFHHAAYSGNGECWFEELKKKILQESELKVLLNKQTNCGWTVLHCSEAGNANIESIRWMLQNGVSMDIVDECNMLAYEEYGGNKEKLIRELTADNL